MIKSMKCGFYLRDEAKTAKHDDNVRIMGTINDKNSVHQLWMIKYIRKKEHEIVHTLTDMVLTIEDQEAKL